MLIEKQEELKSWLTSHLEPLCDADPAALAKYVLALIKKDKTVEELKESMVSQMDVFLQNETKSFVEMLFTVVDTKEYISPAIPAAKDAEESFPPAEAEAKIEADSTTPIREPERLEAKERGFGEDRRRLRSSPPRERRLASRLGPREPRERGGRSFRSRSRSLSPRHDRFRSSRDSVRRRSRSPPLPPRRPPSPRRGRSVDRERRTSRDSTPTRDEGAGYTPSPAKKPRCRDYDEKGFCLRGDLCKFDHGSDAVVLEDGGAKAVPGYQPAAPGEPYVPGLPNPLAMTVPPPGYAPGIISVPPPGYPPQYGKRPHDGGLSEPAAKRFDFQRVGRGRGRGRGRGGYAGGRGGGVLAVRNIPMELNTITHLNSHFSRFGNLINVQVQFEGDPGSALITYGSNEEAAAAFNTPEAVMNNRFIKVFWHNDKGNVKDRLGASNSNMVVVHGGEKITKTINNDGAEVEAEVEADANNPEKVKEKKDKAIEAIQKNQEMMQLKHDLLKKAEEKRREALVQQEGLIKSKQTLMEGLIEQQKALILKIDKGKGTMAGGEKAKIMKLLKELTTSIDRTKEDIKTSLSMATMKSKTRSQLQKELLDAELELFTKEQDNEETADIQQKVNSLRLEAAKIGVLPTSRGRGRGGWRGRGGRGAPRGFTPRGRGFGGRGRGFTLSPGAANLDRRPSRILVSGYELEEKEELVQHFAKFGEILEQVEDEVTPSIILKFKTRRFAESAMTTGKHYRDRTLSLSWYSQAAPGQEVQGEEQRPVQFPEEEADDYTPPQEDYLPPGLQEHEDILSQASQEEKDDLADPQEELNDTNDAAEDLNEDLLDDEEEEDDEKSWKRRNNEDD